MRRWIGMLLVLLTCAGLSNAQTVEELVAKNLEAMGGTDKINAIKSLRIKGRLQTNDFAAQVGEEWKAPDLIRETFTLQGMTQVEAYNGEIGWQISPFEGRRDPERLGEDDTRDLVDDAYAYLYDPLVNAEQRGSTVEYLGMSTVDGDDAYLLKVTLKNGDVIDYYLDPDTYMGIRMERKQFLRGTMREQVQNLGSYKQVAGVYFPYSIETGRKGRPASQRIAVETVEANAEIPDSVFAMPSGPATASPQSHPEPPANKPPGNTAKPPKPPQKPPQGGTPEAQ